MTAHNDGIERELEDLRTVLLQLAPARFEGLVVALIAGMLDLRLAHANAGYQFGGDGGPVGRAGRRFRIEAKRYGSSEFSARDLIGGFQQARMHDPALEAWFPVATRDVPEQIALQLEAQADEAGVPIVIIDWDKHGIPALAALCSSSPEIVGSIAGAEARRLAAAVASACADERRRLDLELRDWRIGYEVLRSLSHEDLAKLWSSRRASLARLGQDAAGADERPLVRREAVSRSLDEWWTGPSLRDAPAVIEGLGGMGKTWAALAWLVERPDLPIVVTIPAGALTSAFRAGVADVEGLIGERLADMIGVRDKLHWTRRVRVMLKRPVEHGPAFCLLLDGLNQNAGIAWVQLLHILQDHPFRDRVRVLVTVRQHYLLNDLGRLRGLAEAPTVVTVGQFDDDEGGEFDGMLDATGLTRTDLGEDLIRFARTPRLFSLVVGQRGRLREEGGAITVHRLLWEYGRDTLGMRSGISFSEHDWREWLAEIARRERSGMKDYTAATLAETAARPGLRDGQVEARISDIVDGNLTVSTPDGRLKLIPEIVAHALGLALLLHLGNVATQLREDVGAALDDWLDPIAGLDERAEVLRAAASIIAERDADTSPQVAGSIVSAWLQTQNLPPEHRKEVERLAPWQVGPLLTAIELSDGGARASARELAVDALRSIDPADSGAYGLIVARCVCWAAVISRDVTWRIEGREQIESSRVARLVDRIGFDTSRQATVLGVPLDFVEGRGGRCAESIAPLLDGRPLAGAVQVFLRVALSLAIRGRDEGWDSAKWLCLLNEVDPAETAVALRILAANVAARTPETGINEHLPARVSSLLLWLTGYPEDDDAASANDPGIDHPMTYERDYLADPGRSWFRLERRHAAQVLADRSLPVVSRMQRGRDFLLDPSFDVPAEFVRDVVEAAAAVDASKLDIGRSLTAEDLSFEQLRPVLARCSPADLAALERRRLADYAVRPAATADSSAWSAHEAILVADGEAALACRALRLRITPEDKLLNISTPGDLMVVEIIDLTTPEQIETILAAEPEHIFQDLAEVLGTLTPEEVDVLIEANRARSRTRIESLVALLSIAARSLSDAAWTWVEPFAFDVGFRYRGAAFDILLSADAVRFGRKLLDRGWTWAGDDDEICRRSGSLALVEAGADLPFETIAAAIVPFLLPLAVARRGGIASDARMAGAILDGVVRADLPLPVPGGEITVRTQRVERTPGALSIAPWAAGDESDPMQAIADAFSDEGADRARLAVVTAGRRIREARKAGASLYLESVRAAHLAPIIEHCPGLVADWLEGAVAGTGYFRRRVRLAEGLYVALCEALLCSDDERGAILWRALRTALVTTFRGIAQVSELVLMLFRTVRSRHAAGLLDGLLNLAETNTDAQLMDLAVGAQAAAETSWIEDVCSADAMSVSNWRRRRGVVLEGFGTGARLPVGGACLEGSDHGSVEARRFVAARRLSGDAIARHWWRAFVDADEAETAYAAWRLFIAAADQRALAWVASERWPDDADGWLDRRKRLQLGLNYGQFEKSALTREEGRAKQFLGRDVVDDVSPWYRAP